jgi:hypothetical protein
MKKSFIKFVPGVTDVVRQGFDLVTLKKKEKVF